MSSDELAVSRVLDAYCAAVLAKDADALMALYDAHARVFDAWGVWVYEGAPSWRRAVEAWFQSLGAEAVKVSFDDVAITATRDLSFVSAVCTYAAISPQGAELRRMQNRLSWVLRTRGHVPRIVHEHTSAPLGFEDGKGLLVRKPAA